MWLNLLMDDRQCDKTSQNLKETQKKKPLTGNFPMVTIFSTIPQARKCRHRF